MEVQLIVKQEVYRQEQFYLKSASVGFVFYINKIVMTKKSTWNNILRGCYFNSNITLEKKKQERTKPSPAEQIPLSINKCQGAASSHVQENSIPAYRDVRSLPRSLPPSVLCAVLIRLHEMGEMKRWHGCLETFTIVIKDKARNGRKQDLE